MILGEVKSFIICHLSFRALLVPQQRSVRGLSFCIHGKHRGAAVVVELHLCFAFFVQLEVWIPIECAAIVFLVVRGNLLAVIGRVELSRIGKAREEIAAVAIGDAT